MTWPMSTAECDARGYHICMCHGMHLDTQHMDELGAWGCLDCGRRHPEMTDDRWTALAGTLTQDAMRLANYEKDQA